VAGSQLIPLESRSWNHRTDSHTKARLKATKREQLTIQNFRFQLTGREIKW
jgi:hypothetical protein